MSIIRNLRTAKGMKQIELANALKVSQATLSNWERGVHDLDSESLIMLSRIFNVSIDYILGIPEQPTAKQNKGIRIPVLGTIPAGIPIEAIEDILDYEEIPSSWGKGGQEYFALKLQGDSMSPKYLENDIVIFLASSGCDSGDDCAVIINGDNATFKRVIKQINGVTIQPLNTDGHVPTFYSNEDVESLPVRVIGVAKEIRRKI